MCGELAPIATHTHTHNNIRTYPQNTYPNIHTNICKKAQTPHTSEKIQRALLNGHVDSVSVSIVPSRTAGAVGPTTAAGPGYGSVVGWRVSFTDAAGWVVLVLR